MNTESEHAPLIESWDSYWQGAMTSDAYTGGESTHPLVLGFWRDYFQNVDGCEDKPRIIDIASGNGAVVSCATGVFRESLPEFTCLDVSDSAINMLEERFPGVQGLVADAANIPLDSASYDVATSQFGLEYAGPDALDEVARLIAPDGELVLMLHYRDGVIFQECSASLEAIKEMEAAEFVPRCTDMFEAGFAAMQSGDLEYYKVAIGAFAPAIKAMEAIMMKHGRDVAAGTILKVYRDVRTMHSRMRHYDPAEIKEWLLSLQQEIVAYAGRMASMRDAAIDASKFGQVRDKLVDQGFEILRAEPLAQSEQDLPLAWALIAKKR